LALDDVFGPENFVAQFVWRSRQFTDARANTNVSTDHEYLLCYARDAGFAMRGVERDESKFANPDNDPRGPWMSRSLLGLATRDQRPNLHYDIVEPATGRRFPPNAATGWRYSPDRMETMVDDDRILFPRQDTGRPREKKFRSDMSSEFIAFRSIVEGVYTADGTQEIRGLFDAQIFDFPKPAQLLRQIIEQAAGKNELVMDFFAGSGTTGHAVMAQNAADGGARRYADIAYDPDIACARPCPPPSDTVDAVMAEMMTWLGIAALPADVVLCVPSMASETWALAALFPELPGGDESESFPSSAVCLECRRDVKAILRRLGKHLSPKLVVLQKGVLKNHGKGFRAQQQRIAANWQAVTTVCTQALRFETDLAAVLP
jgi:hypothetical protein